jgi:hypothetical protein
LGSKVIGLKFPSSLHPADRNARHTLTVRIRLPIIELVSFRMKDVGVGLYGKTIKVRLTFQEGGRRKTKLKTLPTTPESEALMQ